MFGIHKRKLILILCFLELYYCEESTLESMKEQTEKLNEDYVTKWPGHLQPLASNHRIEEVEVLKSWPSPSDFFADYVDKSKPVLFKGLAKPSPAYSLWSDKYLANHEGSDKEEVYVEPDKKENRTKPGKMVTFKHFIEVYQKESIYMVHGLPENIRKDVLMPSPLRCKETRRLLVDCVTWFSSGGTKSLMHHDDLDNINCLFRGSKRLLFIDPVTNKDAIPPELFTKGYADVDVERVDFEKYPMMKSVDKFIEAKMEAGDCLFIPYNWVHQVNSFANDDSQNVAVNIWFKHSNGHQPKQCNIPENECTTDKYKFHELEKKKYEDEDPFNAPEDSLLVVLEGFLEKTKKKRANFKTFLTVLKREKGTSQDVDIKNQNPHLTEYDLTKINFPPEFNVVAKELFDAIDVNHNGVINIKDFDMMDYEEHKDIYEGAIHQKYEKVVQYLENLIMSSENEIPLKDEETEPIVKRDEL